MPPSYRSPRKPYDPNDAFDCIKAYLPKGTIKILREMSLDLQLPISRLVAIAVDNELDVQNAFNYPCAMPTSPFVEFAFADEAGKLLNFMAKFPTGVSTDTLLLCRRDIGIESRAEVMLAYRELLEKGLIEEFRPTKTRFAYHKDYRRVRVKDVAAKDLRRPRYKRVEGESTRHQQRIRDEDIGDET